MNAVHVGSDQHQPQRSVEPQRQADVPVIEQSGRVQQDFKNHHRQRRRAEQRDDDGLPRERQQCLDDVKTDAGRRIKVEIDVMHQM